MGGMAPHFRWRPRICPREHGMASMNRIRLLADPSPGLGSLPVSSPMRFANAIACLALALAWLLPNHVPPWMFFLQEALVGGGFALLAVSAFWGLRGRIAWRWPELLAASFVLIVTLQYLAGVIGFAQSAWMSALYLLGFVLASQTGAALEQRQPDRALSIVTVGCLLAGLLSVVLQLVQLAGLGPDDVSIWLYRGSPGRPAANLGQPNLLATAQVIALLGAFRLWRLQRVPGVLAFLAVLLLLLGIALTQSRTGLLNTWIVCLLLLTWNKGDAKLRRWLVALGLLATGLFVAYMHLGPLLSPAIDAGLADRGSNLGTRPFAWRLFAAAIAQQPITGYGWDQTFRALLAVAPHYPQVPEIWLQTHNLLLDLAVWNGLPVAVAATGILLAWFLRCARHAADEGSRSLLLVVVVVMVHALLEYPLTYAFVLLPFGLVAGALGERTQATVIWRAPRWTAWALLAAAVAAMALTVRDYLRVEHSYRQLLLEKARIQVTDDRAPPDTAVLTSLRDLIVLSRLEPRSGMSAAELQWMAEVVRTHPGAYNFAKVARALAYNGREAEAQLWVEDLCRLFPARQCAAQAADWADQVPGLGGVVWPRVPMR